MERYVKRLRLEHGQNIRDLGGYETEDGSVTRFGKLLRSGGLHSLTEAEWRRLYDYGVRTILDLRSQAEIDLHPDQVPEGMAWYHCPLQTDQIDPKDLSGSAEKAFEGSLTEGYLTMVKRHGALLASALKRLTAGLAEGAVLFHCTAGKDRTGLLASAVYFLCNAADEDIIADYEVTYTYNKKGMDRLLGLLDEETRARMEPYMRSDASGMEKLLALYREIDLPEYLKQYGFTERELERLRKEFLVEV